MFLPLIALGAILGHDATPELTVTECIKAFNRRDWRGFFSRFDHAKVDEASRVYSKVDDLNLPHLFIEVSSASAKNDSATVKLVLSSLQRGSTIPQGSDEVHLRRTGGDWKIVGGGGPSSPFTGFAMESQHPKVWVQARSAVLKGTRILADMRQFAIGVMMHANDNNGKIGFNQGTMKTTLDAYLKGANVWIGPDGEALDFRVNPNLVGKSLSGVAEPAKCVMVTLGPKEKLRYIGETTPIAFVDGHVMGVKRQQVARLRWK